MDAKPYQAGDTVVFIRPSGAFSLRMTGVGADGLVSAARSMGATHVVMQDYYDDRTGMPVWGVFSMRHVQRDFPRPGLFSFGLPVRTFKSKKPDGAVMWAVLHQGGK